MSSQRGPGQSPFEFCVTFGGKADIRGQLLPLSQRRTSPGCYDWLIYCCRCHGNVLSSHSASQCASKRWFHCPPGPPHPFHVTVLPVEIVKPWKSWTEKTADIPVATVLRCYVQSCNCNNLLTYYATSGLRKNNTSVRVAAFAVNVCIKTVINACDCVTNWQWVTSLFGLVFRWV